MFGALLAQGGEDVVLTVFKGPALHHSRFAAEDRRRLDDAVVRVIGKVDRPPAGVVVIGTQTLEQSLDIDAVKHLVLCRLDHRPPRLDLAQYPHLPAPRVTTTVAADYLTLLGAAGAE